MQSSANGTPGQPPGIRGTLAAQSDGGPAVSLPSTASSTNRGTPGQPPGIRGTLAAQSDGSLPERATDSVSSGPAGDAGQTKGRSEPVASSNPGQAQPPRPAPKALPAAGQTQPARQPLRRQSEGRVFGGVAGGVAQHLGLSIKLVRWIFVITGLMGAGLGLYIFLWVTVPGGQVGEDPKLARLAPRLRLGSPTQPAMLAGAGLALIVLAAIMFLSLRGYGVPTNWLWPSLVFLGALALAWSQLEGIDATRTARSVSVIRLVGALILVVVAIVLMINQGQEPTALLAAVGAGLGVLLGVALVLAPWWLRLIRALGEERAARAREAERADIAAHLHDSVLQTLAVIRARADQPNQVRRLARAQERELRTWLYQDREQSGTSLAGLLTEVAGEVEDLIGVEVGVVLVGDCHPTAALEALLGATREALLNAARHGAPPVSLYGELAGETVAVFVKDRGQGFDLAGIPADRLGVRQSVIGRMQRHGGQAQIISAAGRGTEIRLTMPKDKEPTSG